MDLMHHENSCSDDEGEGHARLMALAAQVATQRGPTQPVSQTVAFLLWKALALRHLRSACKISCLPRARMLVRILNFLLLQDILQKQLERATSQAEQECQAILGAAESSRPPSAAAEAEPEHNSEAPRKHQRTYEPGESRPFANAEQVRMQCPYPTKHCVSNWHPL